MQSGHAPAEISIPGPRRHRAGGKGSICWHLSTLTSSVGVSCQKRDSHILLLFMVQDWAPELLLSGLPGVCAVCSAASAASCRPCLELHPHQLPAVPPRWTSIRPCASCTPCCARSSSCVSLHDSSVSGQAIMLGVLNHAWKSAWLTQPNAVKALLTSRGPSTTCTSALSFSSPASASLAKCRGGATWKRVRLQESQGNPLQPPDRGGYQCIQLVATLEILASGSCSSARLLSLDKSCTPASHRLTAADRSRPCDKIAFCPQPDCLSLPQHVCKQHGVRMEPAPCKYVRVPKV